MSRRSRPPARHRGIDAGGYPVELRVDIAWFEQYRARWLGNDPSSYATVYRMLVVTEMHDEPDPAQLSDARDRRQPRSRPPAPPRQAVADVIPHAAYAEVRTDHYVAVQTPDIIFDRIDAFVRAVDA
jgi:3-oxoadipate enol-lactonase